MQEIVEQAANIYQTNPYQNSTLLNKLLHSPKIAFLDLDDTMTGDKKLTNTTRKQLEKLGYSLIFVSSRTEELLMSSNSYKKSLRHGFTRPQPYSGSKDGKQYYIKTEKHTPTGLLDPDVIAGSTGTQIIIKQQDGAYREDTGYTSSFGLSTIEWKQQCLRLLQIIDPQKKLFQLSPIDIPSNYYQRVTDVFPPYFRLGIICKNLTAKKTFLRRLRQLSFDPFLHIHMQRLIKNIRITDDSNPSQNNYNLYLTPRSGYKARAVEYLVHAICSQLKIEREQLEILIAGDSFPDLEMGLYAGIGTNATFLLVGGSRLSEVLLHTNQHKFAGEELSAIKRLLKPKGKGRYTFHIPSLLKRTCIVGSEAFMGKKAVETIHSYLLQQAEELLEI
ncbi:MAG TPA: hypothetical protein VMR41_03820 [Patescibacteria group bacterium]|nr:hypothetical protein [Patescibacteria group bacterium]